MNIICEAKRVFDIEIKALELTRDCIDVVFEQILNKITSCNGKIIMVGMGKSGHIARKIAGTFSSLGTPSFYLDPAGAVHGDLGMVSVQDIVIMISYSGESEEIIKIIPSIRMIGAPIIAITGNGKSTIAKYADMVQVLPRFSEACHLGLAPTSSTTVGLCYGDALAVLASKIYGFSDSDFGKFHPSGALGKKLLYKVDDVMASGERNAVVAMDARLKEAIILLARKKLGLVTIVDDAGRLAGVITTGDLGRQMEKGADVYNLKVVDVMTCTPIKIEKGRLAVEALSIMQKNNIYSVPVMDGDKPVGTINTQQILSLGIGGMQ